jgi:ribosome biogenesis GTPase A
MSTLHPEVPSWIGNKPQVIVVNRSDMVSPSDMKVWQSFLARLNAPVIWTCGKSGQGCPKVVKEALKLSEGINSKRHKRGLQPRAVRAAVVGFPNVGKSALINRFLGRRTCASAPKPGVTRSLRWVRVDNDLELLDSPGARRTTSSLTSVLSASPRNHARQQIHDSQ